MYINAIYDADLQNGEGVGVTLCVSGCPIKCPGCFNKEAQDSHFGQPCTNEQQEKVLYLLSRDYIDHLSIIGGEPFTKDKVKDIANLCLTVKRLWPHKKIWIWSGYTWENLYRMAFDMDCDMMRYQSDPWSFYEKKALRNILFTTDVLVDGPFIQEQRDITLKWRGSLNQRVIDVQKSLRQTLPAFPASSPILYCK